VRTALIGYTGFVGNNLLTQMQFSHRYNSKSIDSIRGESFDLVVCAGAPAEKWKANCDPAADRAALDRLTAPLATVRASRVILISTVDVFGSPVDVDEMTRIDPGSATAYGRHRFELEQFFANRFQTLIVRLPGLFGPGLKKNVIFDLLHDNRVDAIVPSSEFQFYDLADVAADIAIASQARLSLLHCATEPISVQALAETAFGRTLRPSRSGMTPARYDFRSQHAALFGGSNGYLRDRKSVLAALCAFVQCEQLRLQSERRKCA
jgi:nucleoside-diphosphate-sugar epimerase